MDSPFVPGKPLDKGPFSVSARLLPDPGVYVRVTTQYAEVLTSGDPASQDVRLTQQYVEVLTSGNPASQDVRLTQQYVEVLASLDASFQPGLFSDTDTFFSPAFTYSNTLVPSLVDDSPNDTFYAPTISQDQLLVPGLFTDTDTFFAPTVVSTYTLTPSLFSDTDTFFAPSVLSVYALTPGLVDDSANDTFYTPTVVNQSGQLHPGLVDDSANDVFYTPVVLASDPIVPGLVDDSVNDTFYSPSLNVIQTLFAGRYVETDLFFTPVVVQTATIAPPLFADSDTIFAAIIGKVLAPSLVVDADTFFTPSVRMNITLVPGLVPSDDVIYVPQVLLQKKGGTGGGGGGGTLPSNVKYATPITLASAGLITTLGVQSLSTKAANVMMMVYSDVGGVPSALLGKTSPIASVVTGENDLNLITPVSVVNGQKIWIAVLSDTDLSWALQTSSSGSRWNNNLFSVGPSDPFGTANVDKKTAPFFVTYLQAATATVAPALFVESDAFLSAALLDTASMLAGIFTDADSFWPPAVLGTATELDSFFTDQDVFLPPTFSTSYTVSPPLFAADDTVYQATVLYIASDQAIGSAQIFDTDVFFSPSLSQIGGVVTGTYVVDSDVFYPPAFSTNNSVTVPFTNDADTIYSPAVNVGDIVLLPPYLQDIDRISELPASLTNTGGTQTLAPSLVPSDDDILATSALVGFVSIARPIPLEGGDTQTPGINLKGIDQKPGINLLGDEPVAIDLVGKG